MRIAFAGTPEFAADALRALSDAGHDVVLVLTQPDRPAGRGLKLLPSPVKQFALDRGMPVYQPDTLKSAESQVPVVEAGVEAIVVAAYGLIFPRALLDLPKYGCLNIHASLLPRWRGAAPIQRAILAGDAETGVCIMQMEAGLDTGPVLLVEKIAIATTDTAGSLHDKLKKLGAELIVQALNRLPQNSLVAVSQPVEGVTYAEKLRKDEAEIDWSQPAIAVERKVRAFHPAPVVQTHLNGEVLKIWQANSVMVEPSSPQAGQVIHCGVNGIVVSCGREALNITELQKAGGKRMSVAAFLSGNRIFSGQLLGLRIDE